MASETHAKESSAEAPRDEKPQPRLEAGTTYYLVSQRWLAAWSSWRRRQTELAPSSQAGPAPSSQSSAAAAPRLEPPPGLEPVERPPPGRRKNKDKDPKTEPSTGADAKPVTPEPAPPVDNNDLLEGDKLKEGLTSSDYMAVSQRAWENFRQKYGGGPTIVRKAVRLDSGEVTLQELGYRCHVRLGSDQTAPSSSTDVEGTATIAELKAQICKDMDQSEEEVCLWKQTTTGKLQLLESCMSLTVEDVGLQREAELFLDVRKADGTWSLGATPHKAKSLESSSRSSSLAADRPADRPAASTASTPAVSASSSRTGLSLARRTSGIANLGNTCFMGSSLQCLANIPAFRDYFLTDRFREVTAQASRASMAACTEGSGRLAAGFAAVLHKLWRGDTDAISPVVFKDLIERLSDTFTGYRQHDCMEFIEFVIDGLKEDCNRVRGKKPYVERKDADGRPDSEVALEAANFFLLRNDSDVDDLFVGFEKITKTCPVSSRETVHFEPFLSIKVPLTSPQADHMVQFFVTAVPTGQRPLQRLHIPARRNSPSADLLEAVCARTGLVPERCALAEVRCAKFQRLLEEDDRLGDVMPYDALVVFELDEEILAMRRSSNLEDLLSPRVLDRVEEAALRAERHNFEASLETCFQWLTEREQLSKQDEVYCSFCKEHRQVFRKIEFWSLPPVLVLQLKRFEASSVMRRRLSTPISFPLEGLDLSPFCLSKAESFPEGRCLRAGQRVVIRGLQSAAGAKMNGLEGVAMSLDAGSCRYCVRLQEGDPQADWKKIKPANLEPVPQEEASPAAPPPLYDLIAVAKHVGATSFGHYVAYARSCEDGAWRLFDDDEVREVEAEAVAAEKEGAYVLFYLRRDCRPASWDPVQSRSRP